MNDAPISAETSNRKIKALLICLIFAVGLLYFFSNPTPQNYYDYTFRVAENFLRGGIGFSEKPPSWLNEFVPFGDYFYSVFPLGSVLTMLPFAFLKIIGLISEMPAALIAALIASGIGIFLLLIAARYKYSWRKRILLTAGILFGSWMWTNLTMAGAWQLALGSAMLGECGAIYFTIYNRKPLLAGLFFALAFGNRTEILLTAPIFMFLLARNGFQIPDSEGAVENQQSETAVKKGKTAKQKSPKRAGKAVKIKLAIRNQESGIWNLKSIISFCLAPFLLGTATLVYNYLRFKSFTDFGYARIPGVLEEPWYNHGIFSVWYIPRQAYEMLFKLWERKADFPYLVPNGFSSSILWSSPFVLFAFRCGARDKILKYVSWAAIAILTILLWMHGNSGGWQFGYRYAMVLLPWLFVILLENSPKKITFAEAFFYVLSIVMNAYAVWLFHWTKYVTP